MIRRQKEADVRGGVEYVRGTEIDNDNERVWQK